MEYLKVDPRFDEHPDVEAAGWAAGQLFHFLLRLSARLDLRGRFDARRQDPAWLARKWNLACDMLNETPENFVRVALAALESHGLLVRDGEDLLIAGWEKFYSPPKSAAERQHDKRERERGLRGSSRSVTPVTKERDASRDVTSVTESRDSHATPHHSTPLHSTTTPQPPKGGQVAPLHVSWPKLAPRLAAVFREAKGAEYAPLRTDETALGRLLTLGIQAKPEDPDAEVVRRWRNACTARFRKATPSLTELAKPERWNEHAAPEDTGKPADVTRGVVRAEAANHAPVGVISNFGGPKS